ncbi:hypothetical protein OA92_01550 [Marinomonas sp. SBI22]|nr:hypothetical protein OA92_01550 [Marinomonas sp. SBI22]KZM46422.1 hypothetical protein OA91_05695 [Marinomonas sp. SBI8L]
MSGLNETLSKLTLSFRLKALKRGLLLSSPQRLFSPLKASTQGLSLIKGMVFLLSVFQLKLPILMRPGHWSRRGNTD